MNGRLGFLLAAMCILNACGNGERNSAGSSGDLLHQARAWRVEQGMPRARDRLISKLAALDSDGGKLEARIWQTNAAKNLTFPDSLSELDPGRRARTGIFLVLGYRTKTGTSEKVIRQDELFLKKRG